MIGGIAAFQKKRSAQATIEYILLIALIAGVAYKGLTQIRQIFFGWDNEPGAIVKMLEVNIVENLSSPSSQF
jgi:hypothetical protein